MRLRLCLCLSALALPAASGLRRRVEAMEQDEATVTERRYREKWRRYSEEAKKHELAASAAMNDSFALSEIGSDSSVQGNQSLAHAWRFSNKMHKEFKLFKTGKYWGPTPDSFVVRPKGTRAIGKKFPVVSFLHGILGGYFTTYLAYKGLLHYIAAHGFIVVATTLCAVGCPLDLYSHIQRLMPKLMRFSIHRSRCDHTRRAYFGHSMGGEGTVISSHSRARRVKAVVAMNPSALFWTYHVALLKLTGKMPSMFTGGALDALRIVGIVNTWPYFQLAPRGSASVVVQGSTHNSPVGFLGTHVGQVVPWTLVFLRCHVYRDKNACNRLHRKMCKTLGWRATRCKIKGSWRSTRWIR